MWIADNWKDYEVIDCSNGEKLERWGRLYASSARTRRSSGTRRKRARLAQMNAHYHRSEKGGGEWEFLIFPSSGPSITVP